jgi:uncharacterized membrane protein
MQPKRARLQQLESERQSLGFNLPVAQSPAPSAAATRTPSRANNSSNSSNSSSSGTSSSSGKSNGRGGRGGNSGGKQCGGGSAR